MFIILIVYAVRLIHQSPFADFVGTFPLVSRGKNRMLSKF